MWEHTLQHRFGGHGALAGHAVGNLLIAGLADVLGSHIAALDTVAQLTQSHGRVVPMSEQPLDIEAEVAGLDDDPRVIRLVRGQVAVATTPGSVRRVRLIPSHPPGGRDALNAIDSADVVTLGPGSWFSSVIPHLLVPDIVHALAATDALKVVVLNLTAEPGETSGFSAERHIHMLSQHAPMLRVDRILVDATTVNSSVELANLERAAASLGAILIAADVQEHDENGRPTERHDPVKLAAALKDISLTR